MKEDREEETDIRRMCDFFFSRHFIITREYRLNGSLQPPLLSSLSFPFSSYLKLKYKSRVTITDERKSIPLRHSRIHFSFHFHIMTKHLVNANDFCHNLNTFFFLFCLSLFCFFSHSHFLLLLLSLLLLCRRHLKPHLGMLEFA